MSDVVIVTARDPAALEAARAVIAGWPEASIAWVDQEALTLAAAPTTAPADALRERIAALDGLEAAYVKPPEALP